MILIKLGGSFITYKRDDCCPPYKRNETQLRYRVKENEIRAVGKILRSFKDDRILMVHGGGTHGHRTVIRWREGAARGSDPMMAWEVKWRMDQLTGVIVKVMGEEKVPVIPVPTSDIVFSDDGDILELSFVPLRRMMERDCTPLIRGDLVPDVRGGWSVVSGDDLIRHICSAGSLELEPVSKVIMIMDNDGFMNPVTGDLIKEIDNRTFLTNRGKWEEFLQKGNGDVSGGIWGKVLVCKSISDMGIETYLIGGDIKTSLPLALNGEEIGTRFPATLGPEE
jgi:isopentenyl phosphate kinase